MQVIEALCASILVPHDHLHISQMSAFAFSATRGDAWLCTAAAGS